MKKVIDLTGKFFNGIEVISRDFKMEEIKRKNNDNKIYWKCKCHCGNVFTTSGNNLKSGNTKSCGCATKISMSKIGKNNSKQNKWIFENDIAIGITYKEDIFVIDISDYYKVKDYCWRINEDGYVIANSKDCTNTTIWIHRLIMEPENNELVDHIDWNRADNRKINLRKCNKSQNNVNIKRKCNNTSGYTGVKPTSKGQWVAQISYNNERIHLGTFDTLNDAVQARHDAEEIIHKEFNGEINRNDFKNFITTKNKRGCLNE